MALLLSRRSRLPFRLPFASHKNLHTSPPAPAFSSLLLPPSATSPPASSDPHLDDFLSRYVHKMKRILHQSHPPLDRPTRDAMLVVLVHRVAAELRPSDAPLSPPSAAADLASDPALEISPHLWSASREASAAALEDMGRARRRDLMRRFLHADGVKAMCRFAADVGIRGGMLREFRFRWAQEELEGWEFFSGLREDGGEGGEAAVDPGLLPERKGGIRYRIRGLDLSDEKWLETTSRFEEAERRIAEEEAKPLMGKSRILMERILALGEDEDHAAVLEEWAVVIEPGRADWSAMLDRIKDRNPALYLKVSELLLDVDSFHPTIRDYSRLLEAYSNANRMEDAERILRKMTEKDIKPDILMSIVLVHMYSRAGNLNRAKEEFESLRSLGFRPDQKVYESMIRANLKFGSVKEAEILMREMENYDMKPPKEIYLELLRAFSQRGQVDGAQRIMYTMQHACIPQTLESSALLIEAYGRAGDPDQARNSFDLMTRSGLRPDNRCTAGVVAAYEKKNLLDKALDLLLKLEKDGFEPGVQTYSVLVDWLGRLLLVEEVEQLLVKIADKGDMPFNTHVGLCDMYARAGLEDKAQKSLKILLAKKELLTEVEFERIITGFLEGGFLDESKRVNDIMKAQGFETSETIKMAIMAADVNITRRKTRPQQ